MNQIKMSNKNNMNIRLNYRGGVNQQTRMNEDKVRSLKKALLYSYQAATAILSDGREFRCLINPNKLSVDLDNKILSIPFVDLCLNGGMPGTGSNSGDIAQEDNQSGEGQWGDMTDLVATLEYIQDAWDDMVEEDEVEELPNPEEEGSIIPEGVQEIGIKEGDIICWKENGSHWLVYLQRLEETAYFRADIRRCRYELTLGNGSKYWAYVRGPVEQSIFWSQKSNNYFNKLNYTLVLYVTQNEETLAYFKRFKKIMINGQPWEVQATDSISTPGIIEMTLKETYNNTAEQDIEKAVEKVTKEAETPKQSGSQPYIYGANVVYPYDVKRYEIKNYEGMGIWSVKNESRKDMVRVLNLMEGGVEISILTGKSGSFTLCYFADNAVIAALNIKVDSL